MLPGLGRRWSHLSHRARSPADAVLLPRPEKEAGGVTSFRNFLPLCVVIDVSRGGCISRYIFLELAGENRVADSGIEEDADEVDDVSSSCPGFALVLSLLGRMSLPPIWWIMDDPSAPTTTMLFLVEEGVNDCGDLPAGS